MEINNILNLFLKKHNQNNIIKYICKLKQSHIRHFNEVSNDNGPPQRRIKCNLKHEKIFHKALALEIYNKYQNENIQNPDNEDVIKYIIDSIESSFQSERIDTKIVVPINKISKNNLTYFMTHFKNWDLEFKVPYILSTTIVSIVNDSINEMNIRNVVISNNDTSDFEKRVLQKCEKQKRNGFSEFIYMMLIYEPIKNLKKKPNKPGLKRLKKPAPL